MTIYCVSKPIKNGSQWQSHCTTGIFSIQRADNSLITSQHNWTSVNSP